LWNREGKNLLQFSRRLNCNKKIIFAQLLIGYEKEGKMDKKIMRRNTKEEGGIPIIFLLKCLLFSYILTGGLLLLLALLLHRFGLSEKIVSIVIIGIYVLATFLAGFIAGKKMQNRKFLWGLLLGAAYFLVLVAVSIIVNRSVGDITNSFLTTLILCAGGGTLGGMLS